MNWNTYLSDFFAAVDTMNPTTFSAAFAKSGSFKFANHLPAVGTENIERVAKGVFDQLNSIGHSVVGLAVSEDSRLFVEGVVTYGRKDHREIKLPFACVFEFSEGSLAALKPLVQNYRSYVDVAPLFAP
ncbi:MAG: nuclear transport factor 2 family protein [Cryobacterium sp.]|nr:nuclear transport factor 2 family protein [Oligoflexia bacterium]